MLIILKKVNNDWNLVWDTDELMKIPEGHTKPLIQLIREDVANDIDSLGWNNYKKVLKELKIISDAEHDNWLKESKPESTS